MRAEATRGAARSLAAALALAVAAGFAAAPARGAAPFEGKTLTIVVGYDPGGGYDRMARLVAKHLPKHLAGAPTVVVQNMPGANSIIAANYLYNTAKPDGLTIGTFNRNLPLGQLVKAEGIRFDIARFAWIGSLASESTILVVRSDLPLRTFADLQQAKQEVVIGSTGPGASSHDFPLLLKAYLGANLRVVSGYKSGADLNLAVERREVDGRAGSYTSLKPFIDRGQVRPLVRSRVAVRGAESLPVDEELAPTPLARAVLALRSIPEVIAWPYVAPPGTPAETLRLLQEGFARLTRDPEAVAEAARAQITFEFLPGPAVLEVLKEVFAQPDEVVREFARHVKFGG
ncbi:MAG TPA: tripartite tricarboxylate transporter substrate-binding protein [Thermodesulfobacteriota bacterium]|nr:tripartite tricarboxylate transporter substrate-binding protein [Thermodesulfobacteriota bacterium]